MVGLNVRTGMIFAMITCGIIITIMIVTISAGVAITVHYHPGKGLLFVAILLVVIMNI